jgi:2,4-diaminopentanoate dehydrogenase
MKDNSQIKVIQIGLGPLGQKVVKCMHERKEISIVAAIDKSIDIIGKDLGEICGIGRKIGIKVEKDISIKDIRPDVAIITTISSIKDMVSQIEELVNYGVNVVSSCEELTFPWRTFPELSKRMDELAKKNKVAVMGTGVNPGFLMDFLPIVMTGICEYVEEIKIYRYQDASIRRIPFQKKVGVGLTIDEFEKRKKSGSLKHVGLTESMHMIAYGLGWKLDKVEDIISPVIAEKDYITTNYNIGAGMVLGVQQTGKGYIKNRQVLTLDFKASAGENNPGDTIKIKGKPDINMSINGGINGDIATYAILVNAVKSIKSVTPGLKTMLDMSVITCSQ